VFALLHDRVTRLLDASAVALAVHGDVVFVQLAGVGVVRVDRSRRSPPRRPSRLASRLRLRRSPNRS